MTNDKKTSEPKKQKKSKKPKTVNPTPRRRYAPNTNININLGTGQKDLLKSGYYRPGYYGYYRPRQRNPYLNPKNQFQNPHATGFFNTQPQQQPAPPPRPEPDYRKLAETYLVKEPEPVKKHMLIKDAVVTTPKTPKTPKTPIRTIYTSPLKPKKSPRPKKGTAVFHTFEDLMKVKTVKELKAIFKTSGVPDQVLNKFTRINQKEAAIRKFLEMSDEGAVFVKPDKENDSDKPEIPFKDQRASTAGFSLDDDEMASERNPILSAEDQTAASLPYTVRLLKYPVAARPPPTPPRRFRSSSLPANLGFQDQTATTTGFGLGVEEEDEDS